MILEWIGHAGFMIEAEGKTIYIDPHEGEYEKAADTLLITHSHGDHCNTSKIAKVRRDTTIVVAPQDCASQLGGRIKSLRPGETMEIDNFTVEAVHAYNHKRFRSPGIPFHPKGFGVGYLLTVEGQVIYHAGDTDFIEEMKALTSRQINLALLPSGGTYTMDNADAIEATLVIHPKKVFPMHRWDTNPNEFKKGVNAQSNIQVLMLSPGQEIIL